jgi:hypothetical protein
MRNSSKHLKLNSKRRAPLGGYIGQQTRNFAYHVQYFMLVYIFDYFCERSALWKSFLERLPETGRYM